MNLLFWKGRRVFLTGHTGFKGSWLALWLQGLGAEVTGYALMPPTEPSLFRLANVDAGMTSVLADVRDLERLALELANSRAEIVIHMAAQPLVRHSYADPVQTYSTNVMGTVNLCEAVRHCGHVRAVLNVTTDKCYDNQERLAGYREDEPLGGNDPYSSSKACSELISAAWRRSYFHPRNYEKHRVSLATARAGNVIGGGDWAQDRLVPDALAAFEKGLPVRLRNPHATRPWQHVLEPLGAYLKLCECLYERGIEFAQAWNIGPLQGDVWPVGKLVARLAELWGNGAHWESDTGAHPHEAALLQLDIGKVAEHLQWIPLIDLETALTWTVDWTKARMTGQNMREFSMQQISRYQQINLQSPR